MSILLEIGADPTGYEEKIITGASEAQNAEVFKLLLSDQRINPSWSHNYALMNACSLGNIDIVKLLLSDSRVDPSGDNTSIEAAILQEYPDIVRLLLDDGRADTSDVLYSAVERNNLEIVSILLANHSVDASEQHNRTILLAAEYGLTDIVRLLLTDPRVNPHVSFGLPLKKAIVHNHIETARLLLSQLRGSYRMVIYNDLFNNAIKFSSLEMIELLMTVNNLHPSEDNNYALRIARNMKRYDVERLLLEDPDVRELDEANQNR